MLWQRLVVGAHSLTFTSTPSSLGLEPPTNTAYVIVSKKLATSSGARNLPTTSSLSLPCTAAKMCFGPIEASRRWYSIALNLCEHLTYRHMAWKGVR